MPKKIQRRPISTNLVLSNIPPILQRIYAARGVLKQEELEKSLSALLPFQQLKGIEQAVVLLFEALQKQKHILIVGDFDADGATSTAVAVRALKQLGAAKIDYIVPNRFTYGYGLTPEIVDVAKEKSPDLLITVDNGISSVQGVAHAHALGMQVLITDHHLPGKVLPDADAIVNPNQPGCPFPSKNLAGVGVIFYVMLALRAHAREKEWFTAQRPEPKFADLLDLVALGTVADVVPLDHNNRRLVHAGIKRIQQGACVYGIRALLDVAKRDYARVSSRDLGFAVAPRLNAAGRLTDMSIGIACLLSDNETEARQQAIQLDKLNQERRDIEEGMKETALSHLENLSTNGENYPKGVCLYDPDWHQGVVGIVAARMREKTNRPSLCFTRVNDNELKGSGRSIPALHLKDTLDAIATHSPELILKFGGHAMAVGVSILPQNFDAFKRAFEQETDRRLTDADCQEVLETDGELAETDYTLALAQLLQTAEPWGSGFPEPVFDSVFEIVQQRVVGEKHLKFKLRYGKLLLDAIAFYVDLSLWEPDTKRIHAVFKLSVNEYQNQQSVQLIIEHMQKI